MLKVTKLNVTRFSEDGLYLALADLKESDDMYVMIEAELDRRIAIEQENLRRRHESQLKSMQLTQAIQAELQEIFAGFKGKKTLLLIENLGQEFIEDYMVDEVTCTVYSKVSHEVFNNASSWEFDTIEQARCKLAKLVYYRVYDKFMRNATNENLQLLKRVLGA